MEINAEWDLASTVDSDKFGIQFKGYTSFRVVCMTSLAVRFWTAWKFY